MKAAGEDRGERWLAAQVALLVLAAVSPQWEGHWPPAPRRLGRLVGIPFLLLGTIFLAGGSLRLGRNLTPLPKPKSDSVLVQDGIYGVVRHPIYAGVIALLLGSGLCTGRIARLAIALASVGFFDAKARREEEWLMERFPGYAAYRRRVCKLIPWLY